MTTHRSSIRRHPPSASPPATPSNKHSTNARTGDSTSTRANRTDDCRPIDGLYLGGGGVHPGIPGSLGGGYNAARAICSSLELGRWWPDPAIVEHAREVGLLPEVRIA
jgi:hypothetical protein